MLVGASLLHVVVLWICAKSGYDGFREQGIASFDFTLQY